VGFIPDRSNESSPVGKVEVITRRIRSFKVCQPSQY